VFLEVLLGYSLGKNANQHVVLHNILVRILAERNMVLMEDIKNSFVQWLGKKVLKLDNGTFGQVNQEYIVEVTKVCKHCKKEARKGCCDKYNNKDRTTKHTVKNIELTYE